MIRILYTEEQAMLAQSARDFMQANSGFDAVRKRMTTDSGFDSELYRQMAQLGWTGVALPEAHGGAGLGAGAVVALFEPIGRALFGSPLLATTLAGQLIAKAGSEAQRAAFLPRLASGEAIGCAALFAPDGSWELEAPALRAQRQGEGYRLCGSKCHVLDAAAAEFVVVSARCEGVPALFVVEAGQLAPGALRRETLIDEVRRAYRLELDVAVGADARLSGDAAAALAELATLGALFVAAEMAGGTAGVMELTLDYLRTRKQFGKLIGGYQALKHPMVEILAMLEQARSLLYHAATVVDREGALSAGAQEAVRMAKAQCGEAYTHAADRAIQFHGAIGFTYECHAQLFLRRAQWAEHTFGDAAHHRRHLAHLLLDTPPG